MRSPPNASDMHGLLASAIGDSLKRRNAWIIEKDGPATRVRVPLLPKGASGVMGLSVLMVVSVAMIAGMAFIARQAWTGGWSGSASVGAMFAIVITIAVAMAGVIALVGIWHIVLFVHLPESRKPDAFRFDQTDCVFPRLGARASRASCRAVRLVTRPDPAGFSNRSDAPRQDIRIIIEEMGETREFVAIPHGARMDRLARRLADDLGVPLEKTVGDPWET